MSGFWTRQVDIGFRLFVLPKNIQDTSFVCPGEQKERSLWTPPWNKIHLLNLKPEYARDGAVRGEAGRGEAVERGEMGRGGILYLWICGAPNPIALDVSFRSKYALNLNRRIQNPDIPRAGWGEAALGGATGRGGAGWDRTPAIRFRRPSLLPPGAPNTIVLDVSSEARTKEFICKPNGGTR